MFFNSTMKAKQINNNKIQYVRLAENIWVFNDDGKHLNQFEISYNIKLNIFYCLSYCIKHPNI